MSLLRTYARALAKPTIARSLATPLRGITTNVKAPGETRSQEPSDIAPIPQKDVLTADVISGAPCTLSGQRIR